MKKILPILLFFYASFAAFSQIKFEKGYIIDNNGTRTECLIENKDWVYNPESIRYKLTENASPQEGNLATLKEFGVYDFARYMRAVVQIDRSKSYPINELSNEWSAKWETDTLFLKTIVQGKANLYYYEAAKMKKFFFSSPADSSVRQLIYKQYAVSLSLIKDNVSFRQQLITEVRCQMPSAAYFEKINYDMVSLRKHFEKYNQCMGDKPLDSEKAGFASTRKRSYLSLRIVPGVSYSGVDIDFSSGSLIRDVKFEKAWFPRAGLEIEYILGFNKNKWSFFMEPTYQTYKKTQVYTTSYNISYEYAVNYQSIELPIGVRHYFFFSDQSRLFLNIALLPPPLTYLGDSKVTYREVSNSDGAKLAIKSGNSVVIGGGYSIGNFSVEARYYMKQNILYNYQFNTTNYRRLSLLVGYRFLNLKKNPAH